MELWSEIVQADVLREPFFVKAGMIANDMGLDAQRLQEAVRQFESKTQEQREFERLQRHITASERRLRWYESHMLTDDLVDDPEIASILADIREIQEKNDAFDLCKRERRWLWIKEWMMLPYGWVIPLLLVLWASLEITKGF